MSKPAITYRLQKFEEQIVEYEDLKTFRPTLICASYLLPSEEASAGPYL